MIILFFSAFTFAQWTSVGSTYFSSGAVSCPSIAINSKGVPYVAYCDRVNGSKITVKKLNTAGTAWETVGMAGFSDGTAYEIKLLINNDIPYVGFNNQDRGLASVMKFDGSVWVKVGTPVGADHELLTGVSFAFDHSNNPYIAFVTYSPDLNGNSIASNVVKKYNSNTTSWEKVGGDFTTSFTDRHSLAFDNANVPYIAFDDITNNIQVKKFDGTEWVIVGTPKISPSQYIQYPCLVFNNNVPYVSFSDVYNQASVMKLNASGNAWEFIGKETLNNIYSDAPSLAFYNGIPYISFSNDKVAVMKFNGTSWDFVGINGFTQRNTWYNTSIVFDNNGVPFVAFHTYTYGGAFGILEAEGGVMKYISEKTTNSNSNSIELTIKSYPNPTTGKFSITLDNVISKSYDVQINNTVGEVILKKTEVADKNAEFDLTNCPKGVYLMQIKADKQIICQKIVRQ